MGAKTAARRKGPELTDLQRWRGQHRPSDWPGPSVLGPSDKPVEDSKGKPGSPYRTVDTLMAMARRGTIEPHERDAGEKFRIDFAAGGLDQLRAVPFDRQFGGSDPGTITERAQAARNAVDAAMRALGGRATPVGSAVWAVLGEGMSIKEFSERTMFGHGRSLSEEVARGLFIGALGVLAAHYQMDPNTRRATIRVQNYA